MIKQLLPYKVPVSVFVLWLFSLSGLIGLKLGFADWFLPKTPLNLMVIAILLIINFPIDNSRKIIVFFISFLIGMVVEITGVQTGVIFGEYTYGGNLGPKLLGVPYFIGLNWAVMTFTCYAICKKIFKSTIPVLMVGSLLMVLFDVILEKVAAILDFWYWSESVVPFKNYIAWYVISFFLLWVIHKNAPTREWKFSVNLFLSQLAFLIGSFLILS